MSKISGYHHLTTSTDGAQEDLDFYTKTLGLHSVKRTVLFDLHCDSPEGDGSTDRVAMDDFLTIALPLIKETDTHEGTVCRVPDASGVIQRVEVIAEAALELGQAGARLRADLLPDRGHEGSDAEIAMLRRVPGDLATRRDIDMAAPF